jgi:hypothetical protein
VTSSALRPQNEQPNPDRNIRIMPASFLTVAPSISAIRAAYAAAPDLSPD